MTRKSDMDCPVATVLYPQDSKVPLRFDLFQRLFVEAGLGFAPWLFRQDESAEAVPIGGEHFLVGPFEQHSGRDLSNQPNRILFSQPLVKLNGIIDDVASINLCLSAIPN